MRILVNINSQAPDEFDKLQYLKEDDTATLTREAIKQIGEYEQMPLGDFLHVMNGDFECLGIDKDNPTVAEYLWALELAKYVDTFVQANKNMQVPQTDIERKAGEGCPEFTFEENVLIFCQEYFGWVDFDLNRVKVWEYLLAKKSEYAKRLFQKNYDGLIAKKYKQK